jgi:hypothetical protein
MNKEQIVAELFKIRASADIIERIIGEPDNNPIKVSNGTNIRQLVLDNPEGSVYEVANDFTQDVGNWNIVKPITLQSSRGTLIGDINCGAPDIRINGMMMIGKGGTMLTTNLRTKVIGSILIGADTYQHRGIRCDSEDVEILNSDVLNIKKDIDTQAIACFRKTKNLSVIGCRLEASGENFLVGGDHINGIESDIPTNIRIEECHLFKPLTWRNQDLAKCKNLFELKCVKGLIAKNCKMEYSWADGQSGYGIVLTVRNQYGEDTFATIEDVVLDSIHLSHIGGAFQVLGRDDIHPSQVMNNVLLKNIKIDDLNKTEWAGTGHTIYINSAPKNFKIDGFEVISGTKVNSFLSLEKPTHKLEGFSVKNVQRAMEGKYGIFGASVSPATGAGALAAYCANGQFEWENVNVVRGGENNIKWPVGTTFIS